jgi:competence protein ComEC
LRSAALAFLCGILLIQQMPALPSLWWGLLLLPAIAFATYRPRLLPLVFFFAGALWLTVRAGLLLNDALAPALEGQDIDVQGWVADIPQHTDRGVRFVFDVEAARRDDASVTTPRHIVLTVYDAGMQPHAGEHWALRVRLKRPHGFQNPGGFDYEGHLFQQRLRATGYVRQQPAPRRLAAEAPPWRYRLAAYRESLGAGIATLLSGHPMTGLVTALANGDERAVQSEQWQVLRRTGTAHLVAISGMQVSLVAGLVFFLARWLWSRPGYTVLHLPAPQAGAMAAVLAGLGYVALAGFSIPTQRALIMLVVILAGTLVRRRVAPSTSLAAALLLVLLVDPLSVMAGGFWLSFLAVAAILYVAHGSKSLLPVGRLRQWGRIQWAVTLGLAPVLLALFQQASLSSPLANLIAIPVIDLIVVPLTLAGILGLVLSPEWLAPWLFQAAAGTLSGLWHVLQALAELPHSVWAQHSPPPWTLGAALVGVLVLLAPQGWPGRWLGAVWLLPLFLARPPSPAPGVVEFALLDVGQGLAAVVRTRHHTLVYDTGPRFSAQFDAGRAVLAPYLRQMGVGRVDGLVVSHGDNDHIGGAASLREEIPVGRVLSSVPQRLEGAEACIAPQEWTWDGVRFALIHPTDPGRRHNDSSCVLHIQGPYGSLLLPGDIEHGAEALLVETQAAALRADVLVAPHHGSKTSSTADFLARVQPHIVLFPVGYRNRYHHPHPTVRGRYAQLTGQLYDSPGHGAVQIHFGPAGRVVSTYRQDHRRYWFSD